MKSTDNITKEQYGRYEMHETEEEMLDLLVYGASFVDADGNRVDPKDVYIITEKDDEKRR